MEHNSSDRRNYINLEVTRHFFMLLTFHALPSNVSLISSYS